MCVMFMPIATKLESARISVPRSWRRVKVTVALSGMPDGRGRRADDDEPRVVAVKRVDVRREHRQGRSASPPAGTRWPRSRLSPISATWRAAIAVLKYGVVTQSGCSPRNLGHWAKPCSWLNTCVISCNLRARHTEQAVLHPHELLADDVAGVFAQQVIYVVDRAGGRIFHRHNAVIAPCRPPRRQRPRQTS